MIKIRDGAEIERMRAGCSFALKAHRVPVAASDPGLARTADSAGL